ncbi:hypothetical protein FJT64_000816 [Amphibalanus amphitrite]|uniref:Uncharacterized protein n=1 Tax=Amphibalanus amphitrite TaxID=1232801 RepID=A0A6A4VWE3_AMPAM|nr:hypothetical protein FJT64_000816 [Amphibalanus amphitrite]
MVPLRGRWCPCEAVVPLRGRGAPARPLVPLGPDRTVVLLTSLKCPRQARDAPDSPKVPLRGQWVPLRGQWVPLASLWCPWQAAAAMNDSAPPAVQMLKPKVVSEVLGQAVTDGVTGAMNQMNNVATKEEEEARALP